MILILSKVFLILIHIIYVPTLIIFRIFRTIKRILVGFFFFFIKFTCTDLYPDDHVFDPPIAVYSIKNILSWFFLLRRWLYIINFFCYLIFSIVLNFFVKSLFLFSFLVYAIVCKFFIFKERLRIKLKIKYANMVFSFNRIRWEDVFSLDKDLHLLFWTERKKCKHTGFFFMLFLLKQLLILILKKLYILFLFFEYIILYTNYQLCCFFKEPKNYLICLWKHTHDVFLGNFPQLKKNIEEILSKSKKGRFLTFLDVLWCILTYIKNAYN